MPEAAQTHHDAWRLPDAFWERILPLLPPRTRHPWGCQRPRVDARKAMDALFVVLRTGCQWKALNAPGICSQSAAHRRFHEWTEADVFVAVWEQGLVAYDAWRGIDWEWLAMDGAMTKAPLGGEQGGQAPHGPRQARHHTPRPHRRQWGAHRPRRGRGNRHDCTLTRETLESLAVERPDATDDAPQGMGLEQGDD
jgi:transposase